MFKDVTRRGGPYFTSDHVGRGVALGDLDNDGRCDAVISHVNEPVTLLQNACSNGNHWLGIELMGKHHRDVVGARIVVKAGGGTQTRFAKSGGSYASVRDPRHLFGLGKDDRIDTVRVIWPSGEHQEWQDLAIDRYWLLTESKPEAVPR
jgi:hypothetical protein